MAWMVAVLLLFALAPMACLLRRGWTWAEAARIGLLSAVGFCVAGPFLTESGLGTGEAYNYSEATADTVAQMRAGVFPVLVGQSVHAFNGRVHPLRTAMYLTYSAGALDILTLHQLSFWGLQNLSLAVSLFGALFCAYGCLRRLGTPGPWTAVLLAILYGLSPALLAAAYGMDLYMTAAAAPFLPIALLGAVGTGGERGGIAPVALAAGLAGAWLAHPPVAAWLTLACVATAGATTFCAEKGTRPLSRAGGAAALFLLLGGFAFVSVRAMGSHLVPLAANGQTPLMARRIIETVAKAGWASLFPVRDGGSMIGDFQLGYGVCLLLAAGGLVALLTGGRRATAILVASAAFLALSLPVPVLNAWLWNHLPGAFTSLTNDWPMQRSYLVVSACALFVFALSWPSVSRRLASPWSRRALALLGCAAAAWSAIQAAHFVRRGYATRAPSAASPRTPLPGNVNLTQTAYAFLDLPRNFTFGPRDPEAEMRLLGLGDGREILSNATAGKTRAVSAGRLVRSGAADSRTAELAPKLVLAPGKRYRLRFDFTAPRMNAVLRLDGESMQRSYLLPRSGEANGFGMDLGNARTIPLWTDGGRAETVTVSLQFPGNPDLGWSEFAGYSLEEVDETSLPIRLRRLVPFLEGDADAPEACWLETPRMYLPGYEGSVDGLPAALGRSQDGTVMVSLPAGRHHFELRYRGAFALRAAFAAGFAGWCLLLVGMLSAAWAPHAANAARRRCAIWLDSTPGSTALWASFALAASLFALALSSPSVPGKIPTQAYVAAEPHTAFERAASGGPLSLLVRFPVSPEAAFDPLVSTGAGPGSSTVFVHYLDAAHVSFGIDQWGEGSSEDPPVPLAPEGTQAITVTMPGLYPSRPPEGTRGAPAWAYSHVCVWLNGREVLRRTAPAPVSGEPDVGVLRNGSGSSVTGAYFCGDILSEQWLEPSDFAYPPVAQGALTDGSGPLRLTFRLPANAVRQCEPLLCIGRPGNGACVFLNYVDPAHVQIGIQGPGNYFFQSPPLAADYDRTQEVTLSSGRFYPEGGAGSELFSKGSMGRLRSRTLLKFNGAAILARDDTRDLAIEDPRISVGENTIGASYANPRFTGEFEAIDRSPPALWPAAEGSDRPNPAQTVGPIQMTVLLPTGMDGRNEPLLVTGHAGEGTIVIVRYVDPSHVMIGADVWGRGLYWGPPTEVDYKREMTFTIWTSALFPEKDSLLASMPPATVKWRREHILVMLDGKECLSVASVAYDTKPGEITVGRSEIGGSNQGPEFTGFVLVAKRLAPQFK